MKKLLLAILIILILAGIGFGIYYYANANSEETLRKNIEEAYYQNQFTEACKFGGYNGFSSRDDCQNAVRCISAEMASLVKNEDLKDISDKMKWSDDPEHIMAVYTSETLALGATEIDSTLQYCLAKYNYNKTASQ